MPGLRLASKLYDLDRFARRRGELAATSSANCRFLLAVLYTRGKSEGSSNRLLHFCLFAQPKLLTAYCAGGGPMRASDLRLLSRIVQLSRYFAHFCANPLFKRLLSPGKSRTH